MPAPTPENSSEALSQHRSAIHRYILSIVRDANDAEDLTQDAFLRAHAALPRLEDPSRLTSWLYRIASNVCYDRFRQASYRNRPNSLDAPMGDADAGMAGELPDDGPRLDKALEQDEMSACVQRYVADLPDDYRAVILLHDTEGLTNPQIAEMLGVPLSTVKIRLHRAREKLRGVLKGACSFSGDERGVLTCEPKRDEPEA